MSLLRVVSRQLIKPSSTPTVTAARAAVASLPHRNFASGRGQKQDEEASEKDFVSRYEREQLKKRLQKLRQQEDPNDKKAKENLEKILGKKLSEEDVKKLKNWKIDTEQQ